MTSSFFIFLFLTLINQTFCVKVFPDDYKWIDNPYENDIESDTEDYHYVLTAVSAKGYTDNYKGIVYRSRFCCYYDTYYSNCRSSSTVLNNYTNISNINETNLKELHHYACISGKGKDVNIYFSYSRATPDSVITVRMRLTNIYEEPFELEFGKCNGYTGYDQDRRCYSKSVLDSFIIPNNSFAIYTFKLDQNNYYLEKENFSKPHSNSGLFSFGEDIKLSFFFNHENKTLYYNSYIVSLDLKKYILAITGHALNSCSGSGCLPRGSYYCSPSGSGESGYAYCYYYSYSSYYGFSECSLFGCVPGSYCDSSSTCIECDYQCKGCIAGPMNCKSCYITAMNNRWKFHHHDSYTGPCPFEFYPLNKVESDNINVPIPLSHRMTFEFWINIHDPKYLCDKDVQPSISSFILQDFFTITFHQNLQDVNSTIFVLIPLEFFYPFDKNLILMDDLYKKYLNIYPAIQYLSLEISNITSRWIYVRGGISYPHKKMFINEKEKDLNAFPFYYQDDKTNHNFLMRRFYRKADTTLLKIQGFQYLGTDIYVRNFNLYSEYMFNRINNPNYFNMHTITDITRYPQLILSVPFTNVTVDSVNLKVKYNIYDFSGQLNEGSNAVIITEQKSTLIRGKLAPKKNFYRLNFLNFGNNEFSSSDLDGTTAIECHSFENKLYCYDDGQPYICKNGYNLMALYEKKILPDNFTNASDLIDFSYLSDTYNSDISFGSDSISDMPSYISDSIFSDTQQNFEPETTIMEEIVPEPRKNFSFCVSNCIQNDTDGIEHKFMRLPNIKKDIVYSRKIQTDMCMYECDPSSVEYCPSSYSSNIDDFKCKENKSFFSYFYQCYNSEKYPSEESALQFSGTMNTKSIHFPLNQELSNFYIEMWFHPDLLTQETKPFISKYFFATNNHHMYFDVNTQELTLRAYNVNGSTTTFKLNQKIYYFGWNHFIFHAYEEVIKGKLYTRFSLSLANNFIDIGALEGKSTANKICFCTTDDKCCDRLKKLTWMDLFIREIKVWDSIFAQYFTINDFSKYNYIIPGGLLNMYNLTAAAIDHNKIIDMIHPNDASYNAFFISDDENTNPDGDMNYNIGWNFNWNDINYPKYIISTKILKNLNRVQIFETDECYEGCLKCFGYNKYSCYSCQPGYALIDSTCTKTLDESSIYYYMNPLKPKNENDPVPDLELNFASLNLKNYSTITLHFYIKIYGFTQEQIDLYQNGGSELLKLITFSEDSQFILYYNIKTDTISLQLDGKIQYSSKDIFSKYGKWIPISIAAFRSDDLDFRPNFNSMSFDNVLLPYLGFDVNNLYAYFPIEKFKISKYLIAHFADITLYDLFIINAYGYAQHKYLKKSIFNEKSKISRNKIIIKTFKMFYKINGNNETDSISSTEIISENLISTNNEEEININTNTNTINIIDETGIVSTEITEEENENIFNNCISPEDVLNPDEIMKMVTCKSDYLPYLDQKCEDDELSEYQLANIPPICVPSPSKCENINQVTTNMMTNCDYLYATCDTKSLNSINNLIYTYSPRSSTNDHYIVCGNALGLDLARFEPGEIKNIKSPTKEFKMEFWFLSQSYVNNHFNSIEIEWTNHIKIEVFYNNETSKYGARCIPMNDANNKMEFEYIEASNAQNRWRYIVCGVNANEKKAYMTNLMVENREEVRFNPTITLDGKDTTLKISENSETNYGVTFLKELRLWNCYSCSSDKAFVKYSRDDPNFSQVLHNFEFESPTGLLHDIHQGFPEPNVFVQFITKEDFNGYGLLAPIPDVPDCNEGGQMYFSVKKGEGCDTMFNFDIFKNDVIFENIPASRANRYTMEFWFYIESADDFRGGMNLIYEDHMAISAFAHNINDTDLDVYCFPQAYRDHLDDTFGENIEKRYINAQNKAKYTFVDGFSKWNYVRCSYSFDLLKYYINDEEPKNIDPEIFFSSYQNDKPFKMFMNNLVKFKLNLSKNNYVRTIIQTINIYRDYIPQNIQTKYLKMSHYITDPNKNSYYPLLFSVNFPENYNLALDKLNYYVSDYDIYPKQTSIEHFLGDIELKSYKTYPVYETFRLCNVGEVWNEQRRACTSIGRYTNCDKVKTFCLNNAQYFWCPSGKYLDINDLTCKQDCPEGFTIPPDIIDGYGICYIDVSEKHYSEYPRLNKDLKQGIYETKFKCENEYVLVNYHCVPKEKISSSGIYFGSKYKFSNLIANFNKLRIPIVNYYVDFWFLFDLSGEYRFNIPNDNTRYTIFIAYPHFITRYKNKIQYNNGFILMDYYDVIDVDSIKYKWNHVVLEHYQMEGKTSVDTYKYINIYWNNDYNNPKLSLKINNDNNFALSQIAFCHESNDAYSSCILGLNSMTYRIITPIWDEVYYRHIKLWNRNATSISSINTFGSPVNNEITMNVISYYPLTIDTIQPGRIKSLVTFMGNNTDLVVEYNLERPYDNSQQINWITDFDITLPNNYIYNINTQSYTDEINSPNFSKNDTTFEVKECSGNCEQCFSGSEEDCISCKSPYLISGSLCRDVTGYYFGVPSKDKNLDIIRLNENISGYKEVTILFYMKFLGTIEQRMGIVPILYFYENKNYLGWDIEKQTFTINFIDESSNIQTIFSSNQSRLFIGKWSLFSISIYASDYPLVFPNMIQFMIDENIIEPEIDLKELHKKNIYFDYISINNKMSAVFYDLRIYNKFFIGAYGIGQDIYSSPFGQPLLIRRFSLKSTDESSNDCAQTNDINPSIGNNVLCIGDNNPYDDPNLKCQSGEYRIVDAIDSKIECNTCDNYCDINYCTSNTTKNCSCVNDGPNYWIRYDFAEEKQKFYCEKLDSININEYNDIIINDIGVGTEIGYMIEFWFYLETYIDHSNFKGVSIIWKHFLKIDIVHYQKDLIQINCFPCSDNNGKYISDKEDKFNTWVFYRCQVDKEKMLVYSERNSSIITTLNLWSGSDTSTTLTIKDNSDSPYGVFLLRELRLYNERNTIINEISHLNLDITKYITLIHYFKGNFTSNQTSPRNILYDTVTDKSYQLHYKYGKYPYSYISPNYSELVLCEEGFEYKKNTEGNYECLSIDKSQMIDKLKNDDNTFTIADLVSKVDNLYNMALGDFNITGNKAIVSNFSYDSNGSIILSENQIPDSYCSYHGKIIRVQITPTCYCLGETFGKYCHLNREDYITTQNMIEIFLTKAEQTYIKYVHKNLNKNTEEEYAFINSLNNLIAGNQLLAREASFATEITTWINDNLIYEINHCDLKYIEMVDNIFSTLISITNFYKAGLITNLKGTSRDANLTMGQEEEIDSNMVLIKKQLEYLSSLCFSDTVDGKWSYHSKNIYLDLFKVPKNGNINLDEKIKSLKIGNHEPYVQFGNCLDSIKSIDGSQNINLQFITWIYSPWYHHHILNNNYTSNYIEIKIYSDDLNELQLNECKDDSSITFYLSLINPFLTDIINNNKFHFKEGNIYKSDDPIFTEPKYILDDGSISDMTLEERRNKYYFQYLLIFKTLAERNRELITEEVSYDNLEDNYYFRCSSNHLSEYLLVYQDNPEPNTISGRFYFLKHTKLYFNSNNLSGNFGFFLLIIIIVLYIINFGIVKIYLRVKKKKLGNKNYLLIEDFLMKYVYPYGTNEEDFFINRDNMNKIYNQNLNLNFKREQIDEKNSNIIKLKQNNNYETEAKTEKNKLNKEEARKDAYLDDNNLMNYGDVKNRKIYDQFYSQIKKKGYNDDNNENNSEDKDSKIKKKKKESKEMFTMVQSDDDNDSKEKIKNKKKKSIKNNKTNKNKEVIPNNYEINDDIQIHEEAKEEIKEANEYNSKNKIDLGKLLHSLQISNENLRVKLISQMKINFFTFFLTNLKNRIIFINTFCGNYTYSASVKALCLPLYLEILLFVNTFIFITLEDESEFSEYIKNRLGDFVWRCFLPVILVNIYLFLTRYFYNLDNGKQRKLLFDFKTNRKLFDKQYFNVIKKIKRMMIFETCLFVVMVVLTYLFVFGLFTVYPSQGKIMIISLICGLILELALTLFFELLLAILMIFRKNQIIVIIIDYLNRLLSYKMLSP